MDSTTTTYEKLSPQNYAFIRELLDVIKTSGKHELGEHWGRPGNLRILGVYDQTSGENPKPTPRRDSASDKSSAEREDRVGHGVGPTDVQPGATKGLRQGGKTGLAKVTSDSSADSAQRATGNNTPESEGRLSTKLDGASDVAKRTGSEGSAHNSLPDNPNPNPTKDEQAALGRLRALLNREANARGISFDGGQITLQRVPQHLVALAETMRRLFGVDISFVNARGVDSRLSFGGVYAGGRTLFINTAANKSHSHIIGHEFLHYFAQAYPEQYKAFVKVAEPLINKFGIVHMNDEAKGYRKRGVEHAASVELGTEEVFADAWGNAWANPDFWKALSQEAKDKGVIARALTTLKQFLQKIVQGLATALHQTPHSQLFNDPALIQKSIVQATADAIGKAAKHVAEVNARFMTLSTEIHEDLGKEGFAATHDSPIPHEGMFDWRTHQGKGEGSP